MKGKMKEGMPRKPSNLQYFKPLTPEENTLKIEFKGMGKVSPG